MDTTATELAAVVCSFISFLLKNESNVRLEPQEREFYAQNRGDIDNYFYGVFAFRRTGNCRAAATGDYTRRESGGCH